MSRELIITDKGAYPFLALTEQDFLKQCTFDPYAASGPGGQKRNRKYTAVRITHTPTGFSAVAEQSRSQHENRALACRRLKIVMALRMRAQLPGGWKLPKQLEPYFKPSVQKINPRNERYALFCAAMLDLLFQEQGSLSRVARVLGVSTGQCGKLFMVAKDLLSEANAIRESFGLKPIKH
jgi:hypothetical protein